MNGEDKEGSEIEGRNEIREVITVRQCP